MKWTGYEEIIPPLEAKVLADALSALPRKPERGRAIACMLARLVAQRGGEPTLERVLRALATSGDLTKAKASLAAFQRQLRASGLLADPHWKDAIMVFRTMVVPYGPIHHTFQQLAAAMLDRPEAAREFAPDIARCIDEQLCEAWRRASGADLLQMMMALRMRASLVVALCAIAEGVLARTASANLTEPREAIYERFARLTDLALEDRLGGNELYTRYQRELLLSAYEYIENVGSAPFARTSYAGAANYLDVESSVWVAFDQLARQQAQNDGADLADGNAASPFLERAKNAFGDAIRAAVPCPSAVEALRSIE